MEILENLNPKPFKPFKLFKHFKPFNHETCSYTSKK